MEHGTHSSRRLAIAIRHVDFEDLGVLGTVLDEHRYDVHYLNAATDVIDRECVMSASLLIILGGPVGVYDLARYPFLGDEITAVETRIREGLPTMGVCLGAQIIARALGAQVRATGRREIGFAPVELTAAGRESVLAPLGGGAAVLHWHGDEFAIPDGAVSLAVTDGFPHQAFALGDTILATQFHLEVRGNDIEKWLVGHAHELLTAGIEPAQIREDAVRCSEHTERVAHGIFTSWLSALPDDIERKMR